MTTRGKCTCPVYGIDKELPSNQLPTVQQIMQFYSLTRYNRPKNIKVSDVVKDVAGNAISIWNKAGIPTVSEIRVRQKIESLREDLRLILKKKDEPRISALSAAKQESASLFDIAACHCFDFAGLDKGTTTKMQCAEERSSKRRKYYASVAFDEGCSTVSMMHADDSNRDAETRPEPIDDITAHFDTEIAEQLSKQDDEYEMSSDSNLSESRETRNMTKFPTVARECDRYGVSNVAGAAIATTALIDYGIITSDNCTAVIDKSKLRRQREKLRTAVTQKATESLAKKSPTSLYFEGIIHCVPHPLIPNATLLRSM